jgi:hypothetical protein
MNRKQELNVLIKHVLSDVARLIETRSDDDKARNALLDEKVVQYQQYRNELKEYEK